MDRRVLQLHIDGQAEQQAADAEEQSDHQQGMSVHAEETHGRQIRQHQVGFASARMFLRAANVGSSRPSRALRKAARLNSFSDLVSGRSAWRAKTDAPTSRPAHSQKKFHPIHYEKQGEGYHPHTPLSSDCSHKVTAERARTYSTGISILSSGSTTCRFSTVGSRICRRAAGVT
jgi:hypothetical protein